MSFFDGKCFFPADGALVQPLPDPSKSPASTAVLPKLDEPVAGDSTVQAAVTAAVPLATPTTVAAPDANLVNGEIVPAKADGKTESKPAGKSLLPLLGLMEFKKDAEMLDVYHLTRNDFTGLAANAGLHEVIRHGST